MTLHGFARGIKVDRYDFDGGGFVIKLGIKKEDFLQNLFNDKGWANFDIKFRKKDGSPYCIVNSFHKTTATTTNKAPEETDEIPF